MSNPTVHDIAGRAGVSLATVDRVLNRRSGVADKTIKRVEAAIAELGYVRDLAAANLAKRRRYPIAFIIPEGPNAFMHALESEIEQAVQRSPVERTDISIFKVPAFDGDGVAAVLRSMDVENLCGVAVVAVDSPRVHEAITDLRSSGIGVVTLVSDIPDFGRDHYAGIDNVAAGRTAGTLLGRFLSSSTGKVAVVAGSLLARDHKERLQGFHATMGALFPGIEILPVLEGLDDPDRVEMLLFNTLHAHPDVAAIYSLGAGNRGVVRVLERIDQDSDLVVVVHELTDTSRAALINNRFDAVIHQDPGHEVRSAIRVMKALSDGLEPVAAQERIGIDIFLKDNLP